MNRASVLAEQRRVGRVPRIRGDLNRIERKEMSLNPSAAVIMVARTYNPRTPGPVIVGR